MCFRFLNGLAFICSAIAVMTAASCRFDQKGDPTTIRHQDSPAIAALLTQANEALREGRLVDGLEAAERAVRLDSASADTRFLFGRLLFESGQQREARREYDAVLRLRPDYPGVQFNVGNTFYAERRYQDAARLYRQEAMLRPDARAWLALGTTYAKLNHPDSSRTALENSLGLDPGYSPAHDALAEWYELEGDFDQALSHARAAVKNDTSNVQYLYRLGALLGRVGRFDEAVTVLDRVLRKQPWDNRAMFNMGRALQALGREQEAQLLLDRAVELQKEESQLNTLRDRVIDMPQNFDYRVDLAEALRRTGRLRDAAREYQIASTLRPENLSVRNNLATLSLQTGDTLAALKGYEYVIRADSTFAQTWINLAIFYTDVNNPVAARRALDRAEKLAPNHPAVRRLKEMSDS